MANFITLLEKLHYLNHPYLSGLSTLTLILMGIFVLAKNPKSELYRVFFLITFTISFWFSGNALSMVYFNDLDISLFWYRVAYTTVPFICVSYYHFYLVQCEKKKRGLYSLYGICLLEIAYLWLSKDFKAGAHSLPNVGIFWQGFPPSSYFLAFGMIKYIIVSWFVVFSFYREYKKETIPLKKKQLKYLTIAFCVTAMGAVEWLVGFAIPLHFAWIIIPPFIGVLAYAIIRYKAMEIDTVIHRTILWILTVFLLILPAVIINLILDRTIAPSNIILHFFITGIYLIFFIGYYNRLRPRIDRAFRRRKYDYQNILSKISEVVATTINIEDFTKELLAAVCETMYLRNSTLYVLNSDETKYTPAGRWGYKVMNGKNQNIVMEIYTGKEEGWLPGDLKALDINDPVAKWMREYHNILETAQAEIDPEYEGIKQNSLGWLRENEIEIIVPIIFENKINALLCLGKKENFQVYTRKDLELLKMLGYDVGLTLFNATHYQDLIEKERLDEEIKMGREIQMSLLPKDLPRLPGISISGLMLPAKEIGGDYYDFIMLPKQDELGIVIGDVSGKGIAAGLVMVMARTVIHALSREETSPKQILIRINQLLYESFGAHKGMTLLYLLWRAKDKSITYSSAGHEHILIYRALAGNVEAIMSGGIMLGMPVDIDNLLEEKQLKLETSDKILLYTDGVTEAENKEGERFGFERLKESFKTHSQKQAPLLLQAIKNEVYSFVGAHPQYDDITMVIMEGK